MKIAPVVRFGVFWIELGEKKYEEDGKLRFSFNLI